MSATLPKDDKALLAAQAKAGPAGVEAYEAAKAELARSQQATLAEAASSAASRGGPAGAMEHALAGVRQEYDRRFSSLDAAQESAGLASDRREAAMSAYSAAVGDTRGLISAQAEAAAKPIRLRGDLELQQMRQRGDSEVSRIEAQMDADSARFEMQMRQAEQAARVDQERWEREMEQRERLARESAARAASGGGGGGGRAPISLDKGELQAMFRSGGIQNLGAIVQQIAERGQAGSGFAREIDAYITEAAGAKRDAGQVRTEVFDQLFPEPNRIGGPDQESNTAWNTWNEMRRRWGTEGPQLTDFGDFIGGSADRPQVDPAARRAYEDAMATINANRATADTRLAASQAPLNALGIDPSSPGMLGSEGSYNRFNRALLPGIGATSPDTMPFIQLAQQAEMPLHDPMDIAQALGAADLDVWEPDTSMSLAEMREAQADFYAENTPNADIAPQALREAMILSLTPEIMAQFGLHPAQIEDALQHWGASSALQLARGDESAYVDMIQARRDDMNATMGSIEDQVLAAQDRVSDADSNWWSDLKNQLWLAEQQADPESPLASAEVRQTAGDAAQLEAGIEATVERGRMMASDLLGGSPDAMKEFGLNPDEVEGYLLSNDFPSEIIDLGIVNDQGEPWEFNTILQFIADMRKYLGERERINGYQDFNAPYDLELRTGMKRGMGGDAQRIYDMILYGF